MAELFIKKKKEKYPDSVMIQAPKVLQKHIFSVFFHIFPGNFYAHLCDAGPGRDVDAHG